MYIFNLIIKIKIKYIPAYITYIIVKLNSQICFVMLIMINNTFNNI